MPWTKVVENHICDKPEVVSVGYGIGSEWTCPFKPCQKVWRIVGGLTGLYRIDGVPCYQPIYEEVVKENP